MEKISSGKYDSAINPKVNKLYSSTREESNMICINTILLTGWLIFGIVCLTTLFYLTTLIL